MGISSSQLTFTHSFQRGRLNHQPDLDDHFRSKEKHMSRIRLVSLPVFPKILLHDVEKNILFLGQTLLDTLIIVVLYDFMFLAINGKGCKIVQTSYIKISFFWQVPSGNLLHHYGKSP